MWSDIPLESQDRVTSKSPQTFDEVRCRTNKLIREIVAVVDTENVAVFKEPSNFKKPSGWIKIRLAQGFHKFFRLDCIIWQRLGIGRSCWNDTFSNRQASYVMTGQPAVNWYFVVAIPEMKQPLGSVIPGSEREMTRWCPSAIVKMDLYVSHFAGAILDQINRMPIWRAGVYIGTQFSNCIFMRDDVGFQSSGSLNRSRMDIAQQTTERDNFEDKPDPFADRCVLATGFIILAVGWGLIRKSHGIWPILGLALLIIGGLIFNHGLTLIDISRWGRDAFSMSSWSSVPVVSL